MAKQPNVLFICTDQQRWDTVGRFKPANLQTPNLDNLVERSVHFSNTFCQAPVCIPSRANMLSGQYPSQTGIYHNNGVLPADKITWARVLGANGYETISVGRAHGINQGFDRSIHIPFGDSFFEMASALNGPQQKWTYSHYDYKPLPHIYEGDFEQYMDVRCVNTACHALRDLKDTHKPWAMYLGMLAPHNPYILPRKYADFYKAEDFEMPKVFEEDFQKPCYCPGKQRYWDKFTDEDIQETRRIYYSMVSMADELLGRVLAQLDNLGMTENTIIVFTSDHGEMLGDHGMWAKLNFYDESIKVPCLVSCPGLFEGGREVDALVEAVDFMPTILDLAKVEMPGSVSGKSFKGLLDGSITEHKAMIYSAFNNLPENLRCVRTHRYCYSYGYITSGRVTGEMYDLEKDPQQRYNVYNEPDYRTARDDLMRKLLEFEISQSYQLHIDRPELAWRYPASQHLY